jgi:hypothetical protein
MIRWVLWQEKPMRRGERGKEKVLGVDIIKV